MQANSRIPTPWLRVLGSAKQRDPVSYVFWREREEHSEVENRSDVITRSNRRVSIHSFHPLFHMAAFNWYATLSIDMPGKYMETKRASNYDYSGREAYLALLHIGKVHREPSRVLYMYACFCGTRPEEGHRRSNSSISSIEPGTHHRASPGARGEEICSMPFPLERAGHLPPTQGR